MGSCNIASSVVGQQDACISFHILGTVVTEINNAILKDLIRDLNMEVTVPDTCQVQMIRKPQKTTMCPGKSEPCNGGKASWVRAEFTL